jgi:translocation and assembly module TamB
MRLRHLIHLCWIPLVLAVLALAALYYLAYTEGGLALLARKLNGQIGPVHMQMRGVRGTLAHGAHFDLLVIDHSRVHIEIENVEGRLAILPLAWQTIRVPEVHAARLLVHALPRAGEGVWQPHFLPALVRIEAEHADVQHWQLITTSGDALDATGVTAAATVYTKSVRVYSSTLEYNGVHVRASGQVRAANPIGVAGSVHLDAHFDRQPPWTVNARMDGDLARLAIDADITEPFAARFRGSALDLTSHWHWQGHSQLQRLELSAWDAGDALGSITASLELTGDHSGFVARGTVDAPGLRAGALDTELSGNWHGRILNISSWHLRHPGSGASADVHGSVGVVPGGPQLDLSGTWSQFRWPLADSAAPVHSDHGAFTLQGLRPFALSSEGLLRAGSLPALPISLRGWLARDSLKADSATIEAYGGRMDLAGELHWAGMAGWQVQGHVADLDVAQLRPGIAGRLNFDLKAAGRGFSPRGELDANFTDLSGQLRAQRASGHAQIAHHGAEWQFNDVRLQLGATRIDLDGRAGSALDLKFAIDAADLGLFKSGAHGRLTAQGSLRGDLRDPTLLATARARDIDWAGVHLAALDASVTFDPHGSGRADSSLQLQGLRIADRTLEQLTLRVDGTTAEHSLALDARAEGLSLGMHGTGRYAAGQWLLRIASLDLGDQSQLHLALEAPLQLSLAMDHLHMNQACLRDEQARLCAAAAIEPAQRNIELHAIDLPMRTLTAGLTAATDYAGTLDVNVGAAANGDEPWHANLVAQLANAAMHKHFENGRVETLELGNGTVTAQVSEHEFSANLALDAGDSGRITGKLNAAGTADDLRDWPLTGQIELDSNALGFISAYVSQIDRAHGRVTAVLSVTGSASQPQLAGELKIIDGQLDAYQINLSLREVNFSARLADNTLMLEGSANAGPEGRASVSGTMRWREGLPYGDLHLQGSDLRVLSVPEARVDASPDVSLHMDGRRIDLHGTVTLPYARIEPAKLADAVLPSSDEVIIGQDAPVHEAQFQVVSNLTLVLGERVTVDTQGLSGRLSGSITVTSDDTGITRGSGELKVEEGKYLAYGRNLEIQHGRLLFSNGLIGDPGLDLRAVKKFPDITAGINVRGTLRAPRMTFFSDPEVSQSQIVSLLLAGGSLESLQNSGDASARANAGRSDALVQGGAILAQQIGGRFDIEAGVEQDLTNETSLVLGRYLSPRLYVSYGVGLAEAINTIKMRYTVGDHWTIKTEAGTQRSADLVYTIEK